MQSGRAGRLRPFINCCTEVEVDNTTPSVDATGTTSSGMKENVAGLLCYVFGWVTGVIFLVIEKENRFVRFHAWQSIFFSIAVGVTYWVLNMLLLMVLPLSLWWIVSTILPLVFLVVWVLLLINAYQGKEMKLPVIGNIAHNLANK